jgi:transcriptional regulator with XRE-family HTH domain
VFFATKWSPTLGKFGAGILAVFFLDSPFADAEQYHLSMIQSIGEVAQTRTQLGLSLSEIALTTRIPARYLEAIERGEFHKLPGGIYTTSYLRQYARAINYPESELVGYYLRFRSAAEASGPSAGNGAPPSELAESPSTAGSPGLAAVSSPGAGFRTLADRLLEGRMSTEDALRYAILLGDALRKLHENGEFHGAVSSETIVLDGDGIELISAANEPEDYDPATDIYRFGVVLREMLTGCKIFDDEDTSLLESTGMPIADRLIAGCLARERTARPVNMQKVLLDIKLIALAKRCTDVPAALRRGAVDVALAAIKQMEGRLTARLEAHEKSMRTGPQPAGHSLKAVPVEVVALETERTTAQQGQREPGRRTPLELTGS